MIFYSKTLIKNFIPNCMILDLEDDLGVVYVTRGTYDQAVLLSDKYAHDPDLVKSRLDMDLQPDIYEYMKAVLPDPLNILAGYYNLINAKLDDSNIEQLIGVLSYISMNLDFNKFIMINQEIRPKLVYTKSILYDYLSSYRDFELLSDNNKKQSINEDEVISNNKKLDNVNNGDINQKSDNVADGIINQEDNNKDNTSDGEESNSTVSFDVDEFKKLSGWEENKIEVPKFNTEVNTVISVSDTKDEVINKKESDEDAYESIINTLV